MALQRVALISGIAGQDGSYLAEYLLSLDYVVIGIELPQLASQIPSNLKGIYSRIQIFYGNIEDKSFVDQVVKQVRPNEIYHLAGVTFVSFTQSSEQDTLSKNIFGTHNLLSACQEFVPESKFFFAGSSEMYGEPTSAPQTLDTPFFPRSVYGIAKLTGHHLVRYYRNKHKMFAVTGILYNHESPRRGQQFVTQKIAQGVARIKKGLQKEIILGNLDAQRDWGHAADFVVGFWKQLQLTEPHDLIFATGRLSSVLDFVQCAFESQGLNYKEFVKISEDLYRPCELVPLVGDSSITCELLGWKSSRPLKEIVTEMVRVAFESVENT